MARRSRNRRRRSAGRSRSRSNSVVRRVRFPGGQTPRKPNIQQDQVVLFKPRNALNRSLGAPRELNTRDNPIPFDRSFSTRRTRRGRRGNTGSIPTLPPIIGAYVDPWTTDADGVRYPDDYQGFSGTWSTVLEAPVLTAFSGGIFTDANMVAVVPAAGTALYLVTPDPSNQIIQGIVGSQAGGLFAALPNTFFWPNGILFTGAKDSLNAFGPGTGIVNNDNPVSNIGVMRSMYKSCRLVAGGVRLSTSLNFSTVSGIIHMAPLFVDTSDMTNGAQANFNPANPTNFEMANGWQAALPSQLSDIVNLPGYVEYPFSSLEANEMVGLFRRYGQEALNFKPTGGAWGMDDHASGGLATRTGVSSMTSYGHYCILIYVSGVVTSTGGSTGPGVPIGEMEIKCHYETQANPASFGLSSTGAFFDGLQAASGLCTPAPPSQPLLMAAADNMASRVPPIRQVDDGGVEEASFVEEVVALWGNATKVASSVISAVSTVATILGAFSI